MAEQEKQQESEQQTPKNHGNTRLPFGLCKRYGIRLPEDATPRMAWDALKGELGITPEKVYASLEKQSQPKENSRDYSSNFSRTLGREHYDRIRNIVDACENETIANVWNAMEKKIGFADLHNKGTAHYSISQDGICIDIDRDLSRRGQPSYTVLFHEAGHAIDRKMRPPNNELCRCGYYFSSYYKDGVFPETIVKEFEEKISAIDKELRAEFKQNQNNIEWLKKNGYASEWSIAYFKEKGRFPEGCTPKYYKDRAYKALEGEILAITDIDAKICLLDMVLGATKGKIGYGHKKGYMKSSLNGVLYSVATETFAELMSASIAAPKSLEIIKKYCPKSYSVFIDMTTEIERKAKKQDG